MSKVFYPYELLQVLYLSAKTSKITPMTQAQTAQIRQVISHLYLISLGG